MATGRRGLLGLAAAGLFDGGLVRSGLAAPRRNGLTAPPPPNIVVETHRGKVRGSSDGEIKVFRGIPYAAATQGVNRFHPPRLAKNWPGVRDAVAYGPMCPQLPRKRGSY
ncbi:MAG TPA: carboxylesterase family protein, partial [Rhodopila sp.]